MEKRIKRKIKNRTGILYTQCFSLPSFTLLSIFLFIDEHSWTAAAKSHPGSENRAGAAPVHLCGRISWLPNGQAHEKVRPGTGFRAWGAAVHLNDHISTGTAGFPRVTG